MRANSGAALAAVIALLFTSNIAQAQTKIALGYTGVTDYVASLIATDEGFFAKRGLDVTPQLLSLNSLQPAALVSNSLQVGIPTASIFLQADDGGLDLVAIAGSAVTDPNNKSSVIIAREGSGIQKPQDLVGKRIGVPGLNALVHVLMREWLKLKGVDYNQVNFVETPFPQMADQLKSGTIDAVSTPDPFSARILAAKAGYVIGHLYSDLPPGIRTSVYAVTREWAAAHPKEVAAFQGGLAEAKQFHEAHPDAWRPIAAKYFKLPPDAVANLDPPKFDLEVTTQQLDLWSDMMLDQKMLKTKPDAAKLIVPWKPAP